MVRKSILIESPKYKSHSMLVGTHADIQKLGFFLRSDIGGAWEKDEIVLLNNPSKIDFLASLDDCSAADYLFVSYSGHGYYKGRDTYLCLNDSDEISVNDIVDTSSALKLLISIDACRKIETKKLLKAASLDEMDKSSVFRKDRYKFRELFDMRLSDCEDGRVIMYSCDINESAGETASGGYFTQALIDNANSWAITQSIEFESERVYSISDAFSSARETLRRISSRQNPRIEGTRGCGRFPFAVWA